MKSKLNRFMMTAGLLLVAAAFALAVYNQKEEFEADQNVKAVFSSVANAIRNGQRNVTTTPEGEAAGENGLGDEQNPGVPVFYPTDDAAVQPEAEEQPEAAAEGEQAIGSAYQRHPDMEMPVITVDGTSYIGVLDMPSVGISVSIISRWSYPDLRIAPCRYRGSAYSRDMILIGHNYAAHLGRIKSLAIGDKVQFTDADRNTFYYQVDAVEQLRDTEVDRLIAGDWDLTLVTCTTGGAARVAVRCSELYNKPAR